MEFVMSYLQKYVFQKKTKDINVKVFNMITNKNEAKTMTKQISCDCKCKFNSTTYNSNQNWNNKTFQCECKNYRKCAKNDNWNSSTSTYENSKYLKSIANTCDEIISVMDTLLTKNTNTIATNVTSTASINCHSKKVRYKTDCYILHTVL